MQDDARSGLKRAPKLTPKAAEEKLERLKRERKRKLAQLIRKKNEIEELKKDKVHVQLIKEEALFVFKKFFEEFGQLNAEIEPLLHEEEANEDQKKWFLPNSEELKDFLCETEDWLEENLMCEHKEHDVADYEDDVQPSDSVSAVHSCTTRAKKTSSVYSGSTQVSSASSARLKLEAKREELRAQGVFLKKKQEIEMEEARLKARKEQLELDAKIAASEAQIKVYADYEEAQDGTSEQHETVHSVTNDVTDAHRISQQGRRPSETISPSISQYRVPQISHFEHGNSCHRAASSSPAPPAPAVASDDIRKIMQRQNDITEMLAKQQMMSQLPQRDVPVFSGDPLNYRSFIRSFVQVIESKTNSHQDRLHYLQQFTVGEPRNLVRSCEHMEPEKGYKEARKLLQQHYGNELQIATAYMRKALDWPQIKTEDRKALQAYALFLVGCRNTMNDIDFMGEMDNPSNMKTVLSKLPFKLKEKWRSQAFDIQTRRGIRARFSDLVEFINWQAQIINDPLFGDVLDSSSEAKGKLKLFKKNNSKTCTFVTRTSLTKEQNESQQRREKNTDPVCSDAFHSPCMYCKNNHALEVCRDIKCQNPKERIKFLITKGLCFGCLSTGHLSKNCRKRMQCNECSFKHPSILHVQKEAPAMTEDKGSGPTEENEATNAFVEAENESSGDTGAGDKETILPIVPVKLKSKKGDKTIQVYAFLDQGSTATFCTDDVMRHLNVRGRKADLLLTTMGAEKKVNTHIISDLEVSGLEEENYIDLPRVFTQPVMPVKKGSIPLQEDVNQWPHLREVNLSHIKAEIGLLIGNDVFKAMEPHRVINSKQDGPYAVKTALGWVINGPLRSPSTDQEAVRHSVNRINVSKVEDLLTKMYNADFPEKRFEDKPEMSQEDLQFLESVSSSTQKVDGHYCIALPLKNKDVRMPDNKCLAEQRLVSLKRKLQRNPEFQEDYKKFMKDLLEKGYATKVPESQLSRHDGRTWFIPHHGVRHPKKQTLRVVFDCAASFQGVSLNNQLLQGPDLTNSLIGVLTRFRKETIGMMADIEAMFYQVNIPEEDSDLLRFLWWPGGDLKLEPVEYRMRVHLFGATSSPSCASYALRRTAEDARENAPPEATKTVMNNFYVDDCLTSVSSDENAIALVSSLTSLCLSGGFRLTKWTSNSRMLLLSIPEEDRASEVKDQDLNKDQLPTERALGVEWDTELDTFKIKIDVQDKPYTRRGILSVVSSAYDPLGFLAPFILTAKLLLRELCKEKKAWDDNISENHQKRWSKWLNDLKKLTSFSIRRCIKPAKFGDIKSAQLHHFSDASNNGYGTVSYILLTNDNDEKVLSFLIGKARVAPLKEVTIPRMELTAAVIAVKVDKMLRQELQLQLTESVFWTDSITVLKYIDNEAACYKTFVANRVSFIKEATNSSQWNYVNTADNPADQASRGSSAEGLLQSKNWIQGPEFLLKSEEEWPRRPDQYDDLSEQDAEIKASAKVSLINTEERLDVVNQFASHFSSWYRLKRATAWLLRLKDILLKLSKKRKELQQELHLDIIEVQREMLKYKQSFEIPELSKEDIVRAELSLIRFYQQQKYAEEIKVLQEEKGHVKRCSHIFKLDPYWDGEVLRVGGRLNRSALPLEAKHPAILHKDSWIAKLILSDIHEETGHSGRNYILSKLRQRYWIPRACSAIQQVISKCITCKKQHAKPGQQKMANLPEDRLLPDKPPFTNTGVDYFGPFEVSRGRSRVKRYGVLFTCMTSRAVHLEVAHSLDTSSCINAIRRFISRRGQVSILRSDNGTHFTGAERELRRSLQELDHSKIHSTMMQKGITWIFNTPAASHHGGVWERQIRTVRKVMSALLRQQTLDDEGLLTLLCEVESIINDRPLTSLSDDPKDLEALTPNHLLLMKTQPNIPPGVFSKDDDYARRRWRQIQFMADLFWSRWTQEYLPLLQQRQKWNVTRRNFKTGDIVLVVDSAAPRGSWLLGRITKVMPDLKGEVRSVRVKTKTSELERPISKICLLEEAS